MVLILKELYCTVIVRSITTRDDGMAWEKKIVIVQSIKSQEPNHKTKSIKPPPPPTPTLPPRSANQKKKKKKKKKNNNNNHEDITL